MRKSSRLCKIVAVLVAFAPLTGVKAVSSAAAGAQSSISQQGYVRPDELAREITNDLPKVPELVFIKHRAEELGLKIYLFGGTAAGFAHYAKWALLYKNGDTRFQAERFDFDITNIFRSNQDLDLLVDGPMAALVKLESEVGAKFPFLAGEKAQWELRPLREARGEKIAVLDNPDFLDQHNDSNSTGLIELTDTAGAPRVRDLRSFDSPRTCVFLDDVASGQIKFYFSPKHETTKYYREGRNPPILSVIRFLIKAFQYDLRIRAEDRRKIAEIIDAFDPGAQNNGYVQHWIEKNGKKLVQNAVNIEYAQSLLEELGLRSKLIALRRDAGKMDTLAWWLSRKPLITKIVGQGNGKTAGELNIKTVAHETNSFGAYESITRSHTGAPNVFVSRTSAVGEAAVYGEGFYTAIGRTGARGTGLTIRFDVDPRAREGTDFTRAAGDYIIFNNKAALRTVPESLRLTWPEYFEFLLAHKSFDRNDRGMVEKFNRRLEARAANISDEELEQIVDVLIANSASVKFVSDNFLSKPFYLQRPDLLVKLYKSGLIMEPAFEKLLSESSLTEFLSHRPRVLLATIVEIESIADGRSGPLMSRAFPQSSERVVDDMLTRHDIRIDKLIAEKLAYKNPSWISALVASGRVDLQLLRFTLSRSEVQALPQWSEWLKTIRRRANVDIQPLLDRLEMSAQSPRRMRCSLVL